MTDAPAAGLDRHARPFARLSPDCRCPRQPCGGIIPDDDCPDHGYDANPAMEWHNEDNTLCRRLQAPRG